jgi:excisionase family DNA binding protein
VREDIAMPETHTISGAETLLVAPAEAMRLLDVSNSTLYELMRSGQIASLNVGRARRIPLEALKAFIAGRLAANQANPQAKRRGRPRKARPAAATEQLSESA